MMFFIQNTDIKDVSLDFYMLNLYKSAYFFVK